MNIDFIFDFLRTIPDVVWSGIVASIITLSGVMLSNASNTRRLRLQLDHEAAERSKERIASLRRDVYLEAAEQMVKTNNYVSNVHQLDPSVSNLSDGLSGFLQSAAKLQLVCDLETSKHLGELVTIYGEVAFKTMAAAQPIRDLQIEINAADNLYEQNKIEIERLLAAMKNLNESGNPNPPAFSALQRNFDFTQGQMRTIQESRLAGYEKKLELLKHYSRLLMADMKAVGIAQIPVVVAIRAELNLDGDVQSFQAQMEASQQRIESSLDDAIAKMV